MKRSRRKFTAEYKARVVLEAIKEHKSLSELAEQFELHPNLISIWKREFLENAASVFSKGNEDKKTIQDAEKEKEEQQTIHSLRGFSGLSNMIKYI